MKEILSSEMLLLLSPIIIIQFSLAIFCGVKIFRDGVSNLNKWAWLAIVILINIFGPIIFLVVGRRRDY